MKKQVAQLTVAQWVYPVFLAGVVAVLGAQACGKDLSGLDGASGMYRQEDSSSPSGGSATAGQAPKRRVGGRGGGGSEALLGLCLRAATSVRCQGQV